MEPPSPVRGPPRPREAVTRAHRVPRPSHPPDGFLRLDLGEIRRPASPSVLAALKGQDEGALAAYPDDSTLVAALARRHGVAEEQIAVTAGTDEAIRLVLGTFVEEGARVLIPRPTFGATVAAAQAAGAFVERVDYRDDLVFPEEEFRRRLLTFPPRVAVLANPDAPTGAAPDLNAVVAMAQEAPRTLFLVNEAYVSFSGASLLDNTRPANVAVLRSFSKDHGLAGLRVGYVVAHAETVEALDVVRPSYTVASTSLRAAEAALRDGEAMGRLVADQRALMERLVDAMRVRGVRAEVTSANFVRVRTEAPARLWAAAFAARRIAVGVGGHIGAMATSFRVTVASDVELRVFLEAFDVLRAQGVEHASRIDGTPHGWDSIDEGMA